MPKLLPSTISDLEVIEQATSNLVDILNDENKSQVEQALDALGDARSGLLYLSAKALPTGNEVDYPGEEANNGIGDPEDIAQPASLLQEEGGLLTWSDPDSSDIYEIFYNVTQTMDEGPEHFLWRRKDEETWQELPPFVDPTTMAAIFIHFFGPTHS